MTRIESPRLGDVVVRRDREGLKIRAHGVLYAMHARHPARTPAPWLLLAAVPWLLEEPPGRFRRRVGLLGYGGGTVDRLIRSAPAPLELIGVEPDPAMRQIAARSRESRGLGTPVVPLDAREYLSRRGPRFDVLLDDIFAPRAGELARPADVATLPAIARGRLRPGGLYAVNLSSPGGAVERATLESARAAFRHLLVIHTHEYAHKIVVAGTREIPRRAVSRAVRFLLGGAPVSLASLGIGPVRRPGIRK